MREWCDQRKKKVLFGGAFDLLHRAHVAAMEDARRFGDILVVNVVSDARVKAKKGLDRPIIPEGDRIAMVRALRVVDDVVCLSGDPDYPVIKLLDVVKPDVLVLNVDEKSDLAQEEEACRQRGITLIKRPRIVVDSGFDTTKIIARIRGK